MSKQIIYNPEARLRLLQGLDAVARTVSVTMGCNGPAVLIQHRTDGLPPVFTRDGVTVAQALALQDRVANLGVRMLRDVSGAVSREVGDGTTTAIVLAHKIAVESLKCIAAGFQPMQLKKGLELGLWVVENYLRQLAVTEINAEDLDAICAVASKNEPGIGDLLKLAVTELGSDGHLSFVLGNLRDELEIVAGVHWEQGFLSPHFATDKTRHEAVLENPYILLYDRVIDDFMDLVPILEWVAEQGRPLLIVAEDIGQYALSALLRNVARGVFNAVAVKPPGYGDKRINRLNDLALLTGGAAILEGRAGCLEQAAPEQLGQAQRVVVTASSTTIAGGQGDREQVEILLRNLRAELAQLFQRKPGQGSPTGNQHDANELRERIALLSGKTGTFSVGGISDIEIKERMVRIENAYLSSKAAIEEGVIPGGGVGLFRCIAELNRVVAENAEQRQGLRILQEALLAPLKQLLGNSGLNSELVIMNLTGQANDRLAFDMQELVYGDFIKIGIIDPLKVVLTALRSAVSVASTLMTSETVVMDIPDTELMAGYSPEWAAATREDPRA